MFWMKKWFRPNDDEFWENEIKADPYRKKYAISIWLFSLLFWYFFAYNHISLKEFILLVLITVALIASLLSIILQSPYYAKRRDSTKVQDNFIRYTILLVTLFLFYSLVISIFKENYPFLEQLICCDYVRDFKLN